MVGGSTLGVAVSRWGLPGEEGTEEDGEDEAEEDGEESTREAGPEDADDEAEEEEALAAFRCLLSFIRLRFREASSAWKSSKSVGASRHGGAGPLKGVERRVLIEGWDWEEICWDVGAPRSDRKDFFS